MKISTINYNNPKQGYLPLFLSDCLDLLDPVLTFDRLMGGIDLNKYLTDIPEYTTGRLRYNPVNMLKTVLFPIYDQRLLLPERTGRQLQSQYQIHVSYGSPDSIIPNLWIFHQRSTSG